LLGLHTLALFHFLLLCHTSLLLPTTT
jgi:hypothetical protein